MRCIIKKILFILLFIFSFSIFASTKHHLIFIHGIAGKAQTFGSAPEDLVVYLNQNQSEYHYISHKFLYDTGNDEKDLDHFSKNLEKFLVSKYDSFIDGDVFSIVAHSQGGLVTLNSLIRSFEGFVDSKVKYLIENKLINFLTYSTPFHGTEIIKFPKFFKKYIFNTSIWGMKELIGMHLFSEQIENFRKYYVDPRFQKYLSQIRIHNIGGHFGLLDLSSSSHVIQGDIAVSIPSASMSYQYISEQTSASVNMNTFSVIRKLHFGTKNWMSGIAHVPSYCNLTCDDPTWVSMKSFFEKGFHNTSDKLLEKMKSAILSIRFTKSDKKKVKFKLYRYEDDEPRNGKPRIYLKKPFGKSIKEVNNEFSHHYMYAAKLKTKFAEFMLEYLDNEGNLQKKFILIKRNRVNYMEIRI